MNLLVLRFSSIGDVALTVPVLLQLQQEYPHTKITVVSRAMFRPFFEPLGFKFIEADLKGQHKGTKGIRKLFQQIWKEARPDKVVDLHSVLRTHVLQGFFKLKGTPFSRIDKGRDEKKQLTRKDDKIRKQLKHTTERYAEVFAKAGFPLSFDPSNPPLPGYKNAEAAKLGTELSSKPLAGIAPLATYPGKTWPIDKMAEVIENLLQKDFRVVLFGGPNEEEDLKKLKADSEDVVLMTGRFNFAGEIAFMRHLQFMISMDSSNMHLATLAGIPVVSIWGATHPGAGFGPLGKNDNFQAYIPTEKLECRPCSVFGNKPCFRKDYACLNWLTAQEVVEKTEETTKAKG